MKNITVSIPEKVDIKEGYRKIVGRTTNKYLMKALRSDKKSVRHAAMESILKANKDEVTLSYYTHMTDRNKDLYIEFFINNMEGK